jgi:hypothetical protein
MVRRMVQAKRRLLLAQLLAVLLTLLLAAGGLVLWGRAVEGQAGWLCRAPVVQRQ